jgi:P27 family predicted phage terminase small subunit
MKRGPKPKPTALKILQNTRSDRVNDAEPIAAPGTPEKPPELSDDASAEWDRMLPLLESMGVLSEVDGRVLAFYCTEYATYLNAQAKIKELGMVTTTAAGNLKPSPYLTIARTSQTNMLKILAEFGGTPSSRSRLRVEKAQAVDELDAFNAAQ